ncbi:uncharacterized protein LOC142325751 [Lycorma delicatula]|uniref:uncharacterized protein LOC142325751 n=1 Tax=Lycorma delicatula TaxID=130591 RepID=UPI003F5168DB
MCLRLFIKEKHQGNQSNTGRRKMNVFILFTLFVSLINNSIICNAAKILAVTPLGSKSHHNFMQPIFKELALRGHQITLYTSVLIGHNVTNIKEIKLDDPLVNPDVGKLTFNILREAGEIPYFKPPPLMYYGLLMVDKTLQYNEIQKLIHSNEKYDLILLEANFGQEAFLAFGHKFRAPVISLHTFSTYFYIDEFIGNPHAIAYRPAMELPYTEKMSFLQRCHNTLRAIMNIFGNYLYYLPEQERLMRKYFNYTDAEEIPPLIDMLLNVSLTIVNSHISVDYARPWVPSVVEVAGVHISYNHKPLPKDLQEFMDNSKNGVIYVSFGSLLPSEEMPDDMREALIKAFGKLKQNVLWKLSADSLPGLSKNVKLSKWLPQQDVLAHPNCLAFITHGGLLSQEEAIYFGVPVIGIPFFGDQHLNVARASDKGFGVHIDQYNISEESILWAIKEVLYKPSYQENAKKMSKIFQDNQNPPLETAAYWIEYVLRHNGAPHLRSEGRKFSYFKYLLLDVLAFMCFILFLIIFSIFWIIKFIYRSVNNKQSKHKVKSSKKDNKMNIYILFASFTFIITATLCDAAKILVVTPFNSKSHQFFIQAIVKELASRGHQVDFYTSIPIEKNITNIKVVKTEDWALKSIGRFTFEFIRQIGGSVPYFGPSAFWFFGLKMSEGILEQPVIQKLIHSNEKYDIILMESHFGQESLLAFGHKFQAPVVSLLTFSPFFGTNEFVGNPHGTSYLPLTELRYSESMTFLQRCHNTLRTIINVVGTYCFYLPKQESFIHKYFNYTGAEKIPSIVDMLQDVALIITNSQISVDYSRPLVPNVIEVAGLHISPDRKPLPKDLQEFMDNSKNGVIYVSFGSVVPTEELPDDMKLSMMKAFGKLKQNVIWKLPVDSFPGLPKNVKLGKWFPQHDILAHPNCIAFITHGGLLSQQEAVYFGVPLIGIPFFADQYWNIIRASYRGFAVYLDQYNITEDSISWAINEVLHKPSYQEIMKKHTKIFHDNQNPPLETAVYWIEYVIRHNGAPHLRSEGRKHSYIKYLLLDVLAFFCSILFVIMFSIYSVIKFVCHLINSTKNKPETKSCKKDN